MGVVVAAHHIELDERVAIKFLLPETLGNPDAVARFAREARAAVKIKSEHVAKVTDVGKLDNGAPYMVMEYLEGGDLSTWLTQRGPLPVEQAVEFILQACEAIAEAHALGIVHRDLKPANLFVIRRPDGGLSVKVLDFGISKMASVGGPGGAGAMTRTSALMGSPLYMSPEQMQSSRDVDARGDVWALGVILYELITGATPFTGDSMPELVLQIMSAAPPPMSANASAIPAELEATIVRCLDKDRGKRFQTVGELAVALLPFGPKRSKVSVERISGVMRAAGLGGTGLALPPSSDATAPPPRGAGTAASWGRTAPGGERRTAPVVIAAVVAALGIGLGGAYALRGRSLQSAPATSNGSSQAVASTFGTDGRPAAPPAASFVASAPADVPRIAQQPADIGTPASPSAAPAVPMRAKSSAVRRLSPDTLTRTGTPVGAQPARVKEPTQAPAAPLAAPTPVSAAPPVLAPKTHEDRGANPF